MKRYTLALAAFLALATLPLVTFEATYTDSSGSKCVTFAIEPHEVDFCYGRQDRTPTRFDACEWGPAKGKQASQ